MLARTLWLTLGFVLALGTMSLGVVNAPAQFTNVPPTIPPPTGTPTPTVTPNVPQPMVEPNFNVPEPAGQPQGDPTPQPAEPEPVTEARTPVTPPVAPRPMPDIQREPVLVEGIVQPRGRPLMTLGRPALLDAERRLNQIVALVEPAGATPADLTGDYGLELVSESQLAMMDARLLLLQVPQGTDVDTMVGTLIGDSRVIAAQPNYVFEVQQDDTGTGALRDLQYAPRRMALADAHTITRGANTTIAVIDTGIDLDHAEFTACNISTFDAVGKPSEAPEPHGTAIAGLIGANTGMMGVAPEANLLAVRAFSQSPDGRFLSDTHTIAQAVDWAIGHKAGILNMSFAGPADPLILKMLDGLPGNVLVVAAAGNNGPDAAPAYPAAHPNAIAVTATDSRDALYSNANRGIYVSVAAPGVDVIAPSPGNGYDMSSGTSIATAHLSGIIALMLSQAPDLTRAEIVDMIGATATDAGPPGPDPEFGAGLVNAFKATQRVAER